MLIHCLVFHTFAPLKRFCLATFSLPYNLDPLFDDLWKLTLNYGNTTRKKKKNHSSLMNFSAPIHKTPTSVTARKSYFTGNGGRNKVIEHNKWDASYVLFNYVHLTNTEKWAWDSLVQHQERNDKSWQIKDLFLSIYCPPCLKQTFPGLACTPGSSH